MSMIAVISLPAHLTFIMLQNKNFIVLLSNQSPGAKIGQKSAAVVNITNGKLIRPVLTATPKTVTAILQICLHYL